MKKPSPFGLEDRIFTRARLGRHWTEERAWECLRFFPSPYRFDPATERRYQQDRLTDYSENLRDQLEAA